MNLKKTVLGISAVVGLGLTLTGCTGNDEVATTCQKLNNVTLKVQNALLESGDDAERATGQMESALNEFSRMVHDTSDQELANALEDIEGSYHSLYQSLEDGASIAEAQQQGLESQVDPTSAEVLVDKCASGI
ncbi:hypothetical protein [Auritidibacter ignavus]|uniref:hypothetical protein n=1 Tax=Auritidibacter ignavus TaxID=678932 RepID=UPI00109C4EC8|nr:hypothetical protein [Auritidibacter ignavus]